MALAPTDALAVLRVAVAGVVVLFLPGWLLRCLAVRPLRGDALLQIPVAFALSVGSIALLGLGSYLVKGNLLLVQILLGALLLVLVLAWMWTARHSVVAPGAALAAAGRISIPTLLAFTFAVITAAVAWYEGPWLSHQADDFYHLAAVREQIDSGVVLVKGLMYAYDQEPTGLNPATGTWHLTLSILSLWSNVDITWLWRHLPALIAPVMTLAFYSLMLALVRRRWLALLATFLQFVLYENLDFRAAAWPNQTGYILLWVNLWLVLRYLDSGRRRDLALILSLVLVMVSWHLLMVEFFLLAVGAYLIFLWVACWLNRESPLTAEVRRLFAILAIIALGSLPLITARIVQGNLVIATGSLLAIHKPTFRSTLELGQGWSVIGPRNLSFVGPRWRFAPQRFGMWLFAFLALPSFLRGYLKRERAAVYALGATAVVPLIMLNPPLITFLQGKMTDIGLIRLVLLPPYGLLLAWFMWKSVDWWVGLARRSGSGYRASRFNSWQHGFVCIITAVALALVCGVLAREAARNLWDLFSPASRNVYSLAASHAQARTSEEPCYLFILSNSSQHAVVATDPESGYYLAGLTGRRVVSVAARHEPPGDDHEARRHDSLAILDPSVSPEETVRLLNRYGVSLVWIDARTPGLDSEASRRKMEGLPALFSKLYADESATIYAYRGSDGRAENAS